MSRPRSDLAWNPNATLVDSEALGATDQCHAARWCTRARRSPSRNDHCPTQAYASIDLRITYEHEREADIGFADDSFDAVVAANVLHLLPDLDGALASPTRVLRPGGVLVVPTYLHGETFVPEQVQRPVGEVSRICFQFVIVPCAAGSHTRFSSATVRWSTQVLLAFTTIASPSYPIGSSMTSMLDAGGRLAGTVLSGAMYQHTGLFGCLAASAGFALAAALLSLMLPRMSGDFALPEGVEVGGD